MNVEVLAVVLNWRAAADVERCVESLQKSTPRPGIIIVDNGSGDGSEEYLRRRFPDHRVLQTGRNAGYAAGNNAGIRAAINLGAKYVWIVNPDATTEPDALAKMVQCMEDDRSIGVCGPRLQNSDQPSSPRVDGGRVLPEEGYDVRYNEVGAENPPASAVIDVGFVLGCSFLIRADIFSSIGFFKEVFFLYYEEIEFCLRAQKHGWRTVVRTDCLNFHPWGSAGKAGFRRSFEFVRSAALLARMGDKKNISALLRKYLSFQKYASMALRGHPLTACRTFFYSFCGIAAGFAVSPRRLARD